MSIFCMALPSLMDVAMAVGEVGGGAKVPCVSN